MYTLSGKKIKIGGEVPTVLDIAVVLSRIPRWAGSTIQVLSVLHHSLVVLEMARYWRNRPGNLYCGPSDLHFLWHDAHEFVTGDIPTPFKHPMQRRLQQRVQEWLYAGLLKHPLPTEWEREGVKVLDTMAVNAEAWTICHPATRQDFPQPPNWAIEILWRHLQLPTRDAVERFERETLSLLSLLRPQHA